MHLKFAPVDAQFIKEKVKAGYYSSETELVKDAVRHMREEEDRLSRWRAAVQVGEEQMVKGNVVSYSRERMSAIEKRAVEKARQGKKVANQDVIPDGA